MSTGRSAGGGGRHPIATPPGTLGGEPPPNAMLPNRPVPVALTVYLYLLSRRENYSLQTENVRRASCNVVTLFSFHSFVR